MGQLFDLVKNNEDIKTMITTSEKCLEKMNYTEHGIRHASYVSASTAKILQELGADEHEVEMGRIAGYLHDVGNLVNRCNHGVISATLIVPVLKDIGLDYKDVYEIASAIGNHEEQIGIPVNRIGSALIIADKSDAHRTRVHKNNYNPDDIHDRVNASISKNELCVDREKMEISTKFIMDKRSSTMEFLKIYLPRIVMSEKAAEFLGCKFNLIINGVVVNSHKKNGN